MSRITETFASLSSEDDLTGLFNRRHLLQEVKDRAAAQNPFALVQFDLDGFARINEKYGHLEGDRALRAFAQRVRASVRETDLVARTSGDEVTALLPGIPRDDAMSIAESIARSLTEKPLLPASLQAEPVTVSVGVALFPEDGAGAEAVVEAVEGAVYAAKKEPGQVVAAALVDAAARAEARSLATIPCGEFVGRTSELAAARRFVSGIRNQKLGVLLVYGERGIGKTTFLRQIAGLQRGTGMMYFYMFCDPAWKERPGHGLIYLVNRFFERRRDAMDRLRAGLRSGQRMLLRELVPCFAGWPAEQVTGPQVNRTVLTLQTLETAVIAMAHEAPMLLLLDGITNLDRATMDILTVILRDKKAPVGVIGSITGEPTQLDPARDARLIEFVTEFQRRQQLWGIGLGGLSADETSALIDAILPGSMRPPGFDDILAQASRGNPLYVEETLRGMVLRGRIRRETLFWKVQVVEPHELPPDLAAAQEANAQHPARRVREFLTNAGVVKTRLDVAPPPAEGAKPTAPTTTYGTPPAAAITPPPPPPPTAPAPPAAAPAPAPAPAMPSAHGYNTGRWTAPTPPQQPIPANPLPPSSSQVRPSPAAAQAKPAAPTAPARPPAPSPTPSSAPPSAPRPAPPPAAPPQAVSPTRIVQIPAEAAAAAVPAAPTPLTPESFARARDFMTVLHAWVQRGRLYPHWARESTDAASRAVASLHALLEGVGRIMFSVEAPGLRVNGMPMDALRGGEVVWDFAAMLRDRLVGAIAFDRGISSGELTTFVRQMCASVDRAKLPPDHWSSFLLQESVAHIGIQQRRHVASSDEGETVILMRGNLKGDRPLDTDQMAMLWPALGALYQAAIALRQSAPEEPKVEETMLWATEALLALLSRARVVTIAIQDGWLSVNGQPLPEDPEGAEAARFLAGDLGSKGFESLTIKDGLTGTEVRALVSVLSVPAEDPSVENHVDVILKSNSIRRFVLKRAAGHLESVPLPAAVPAPRAPAPAPAAPSEVAFQEFEAVQEFTEVEAPRLAPVPPSAPAPTRPAAPAAPSPKSVFQMTPEEFLTDAFQAEAVRMLEAAGQEKGSLNEAQEVVKRIETLVEDGSAVLRERALQLVRKALRDLKGEAAETLLLRLRAPLKARLPVEGDPVVQQSLVEAVRLWVQAAVRLNKAAVAAELIRYAVKPAMESPHLPKEYRGAMAAKMRSLGTDIAAPVMQMLTSASLPMRELAIIFLGVLGGPMISPLVKLVVGSENPEIRKSAAQALAAIGGTAQTELGRQLGPKTDPDTARRILGVLELAGTSYVFTPVLTGLSHADAAVKDAAMAVLERLDAATAQPILKKLIVEPERWMVIRALQIAGRLKVTGLAPDVVRLATATEDEEIARACCEFFQKAPSASAGPALKRVFEKKSGMMGLVKGWSDRTRAAAVSAAAKIGTLPQAKEILAAARKDSSSEVRAAAGA